LFTHALFGDHEGTQWDRCHENHDGNRWNNE